MAGFDKMMLGRKLEKHGWIEDTNNTHGIYSYIPPESLFKQRPKSFYVYDAEELQGLLGKSMKTSEELFDESNDEDLRVFHDVVIDNLNVSLSEEELKDIFKKLPENIQEIGIEWGLSDSVFTGDSYVFIRDNPDKFKQYKP